MMNMQSEMNYIEEELIKIPLFGKKSGLKNIEYLISEIDKITDLLTYINQTKVIHVTGTNGKGSVCKMISSVYSEAGYKVGMFTSPHISQITERIQINNCNISKQYFQEAYLQVKTIVETMKKEDMEPTFFEWIFAMGLYCFSVIQPEILVIEVGIGGRLDTTNALPKKDLCVLTSISLDHQQLLGSTIEAIANEKAGIIKEKTKVVLYNEHPAVEAIVRKRTKQFHGRLYNTMPNKNKIHNTDQLGIDFSLQNKYYYYENLRLETIVGYQVENASIAVMALFAMRDSLPIEEEDIKKGLKSFSWPGRFEKLSDCLIIDGAHNQSGAKALVDTLKTYNNQNFELLLGMKDGKNVNEVIDVFVESGCFKCIYVVDLTIQKSIPKEYICNRIKKHMANVMIIDKLDPLIKDYFANKKKSILIGAGSLYLVSEIRNLVDEISRS